MRNTDQQNQNPFDKLANEMLLAILNTRNKDKNYILNPKDILSFALSCQRFNGISLDANCFFRLISITMCDKKPRIITNIKKDDLLN